MGQGVRTGLGHGGITCVLQTQFSSLDKESQSENIRAGEEVVREGVGKFIILTN